MRERRPSAILDLASAHIDSDLFRSIPVDLMFRHHFVPITETNGTLEIAISDPTRLPELDEIAVLLGKKLRISIATLAQINDLLNKTETVPESSGGGHRGVHPRRQLDRGSRRDPLDRQARRGQRDRSRHQADRHHRVQRAGATRERYSHRDPQR